MNPRVSIIIVNWNQKELTIECLESLKKVNFKNFNIVLVDNGSEDDSVEHIKKNYSHVTVLENKNNLGFSGGNNTGIEYAISKGYDYVYLLNNDTEVHSEFLTEIVSELEKDKTIGIGGSTVYYFKPNDVIWYSGGHADWVSGDMIDPRAGKKIDIDKQKIEDVDEVAGAGMLIRCDSLKKVGKLHEDFFIYFEETDLCQRIIKNNERVVWVPKSIVWHKVSMTFGEESPVMIYLMTRNRWLFMRRHCPSFYKFFIIYFLRFFRNYIRYKIHFQSDLSNALFLGVRDAIFSNYGKGQIEHLR